MQHLSIICNKNNHTMTIISLASGWILTVPVEGQRDTHTICYYCHQPVIRPWMAFQHRESSSAAFNKWNVLSPTWLNHCCLLCRENSKKIVNRSLSGQCRTNGALGAIHLLFWITDHSRRICRSRCSSSSRDCEVQTRAGNIHVWEWE